MPEAPMTNPVSSPEGIDLKQFEGHSPAPWTWAQGGLYRSDEYIGYSSLFDANDVHVHSDGSACGEYSPDIDVEGPDARLIAAAPSLLAEVLRLRGALEEARKLSEPIVEVDGGELYRQDCERRDALKTVAELLDSHVPRDSSDFKEATNAIATLRRVVEDAPHTIRQANAWLGVAGEIFAHSHKMGTVREIGMEQAVETVRELARRAKAATPMARSRKSDAARSSVKSEPDKSEEQS